MSEENNKVVPVPTTTDLMMNFQCAFRANMEKEDPRVAATFGSQDMLDFVNGPLATIIFNAVQQFVVSKCPSMILSIIPEEEQPERVIQ